MTEETRCWLYTRIDAPEDTHGCLKAQEKELLNFAAAHDYEVAGTASDLDSGRNISRTGLARVIQAAKDREFQILLTKSIDRISWDTAAAMNFLKELHLLGIETIFVSNGL